MTPLSSAYTSVQPTALRSKDFTAPAVQGHVRPSNLQVAVVATEDEYAWLGKVKTAAEKYIMNGWISWSTYHADAHKDVIPPSAINALLPLFLGNAHSAAVIRQSMDIGKAAEQHLNPPQTPVLAAGQPQHALAPCSQDEADTRLLLHAADAVQTRCKKVTIHTVDTGVVVLAVASFSKIDHDELRTTFGFGTKFLYIAVRDMVATLTPTKCPTLPVPHAFTGCDTVSSFAGRGNTTAWETWKSLPEVSDAFNELQCMPSETSHESMELLELRQHSSSTSIALVTRPTIGTRHWFGIQRCQSHLTGVGQRNQVDGSIIKSFRKHRNRAMN